ncbi:MAG: (Fe-S)-binding protein [Planctomycetota bacterium]
MSGPVVPPLREGYVEAYARSLDCVHCGLCLPHCPSYVTSRDEALSPRGRIQLIRALGEGRLAPDAAGLDAALHSCLACRACESACPSGVRYGEMIEDHRAAGVRSGRASRLLGLALRRLVAGRRLHRAGVAATALAQRVGLLTLARALPLPRALREGLALLPPLPGRAERAPIRPGVYEPPGEVRAEVGLFTGCVMETLFGRVNRAALALLRAHGCRVHVPAAQRCCGALALHEGFADDFRAQLRANLAAFPDGLDAIVLDSAGCASALKEGGRLLPEAAGFAARVRDLSEVLVALGPRTPPREVPLRVAWDDPCHLCHGQGIRAEPRALLDAVPGLVRVELARPEDCCGSAGVFNLLEPAQAEAALGRKLADLARLEVDAVVTANPGCHLQWQRGLRRARPGVRVLHLAEVLAAAWGEGPLSR